MVNEDGPPETETDVVVKAISDAISSSIEAGMLIKWTAQIEVMNAEGERVLWNLESEGMKAWESMGLIKYALVLEENLMMVAITEETYDEEDDD